MLLLFLFQQEEPEGQGNGPLYRAYTAPMTHRDALAIISMYMLFVSSVNAC